MMPPPEFSRPIAVERIERHGRVRTIEADAAERAALARRFDLVSIDRLVADIELEKVEGGTYRLTATIDAMVVQTCVVSLEPVATRIQDRQTHLFAQVGREDDPVEEDAPEPIVDGQIDLGEAAAQQLALALPAYPRAPATAIATVARALPKGVSLCTEEEISASGQPEEIPEPDRPGAFAALARWKRP